ncbi:hypothetical protein, partial [Nitrincola alkalisediminis]
MNNRNYIVPTILATFVHLVVVFIIAGHWFDHAKPEHKVARQIQAQMIDLASLSLPDATASQQVTENRNQQAVQQEQQRQEQQRQEQQRQEQQRQEQQRQEQQRQEQQRQEQ